MPKKHRIVLSVKHFVELVCRAGDIEAGFRSSARAQEGIRLHRRIQDRRQASAGEGSYEAEVPVSFTFENADVFLMLTGRMDGLLRTDAGDTIEEIKTTEREVDSMDDGNALHWAQAECYAYIHAANENLDTVRVMLTYCQLGSGDVRSFERLRTRVELEAFFSHMLERHLAWLAVIARWEATRDESIKQLAFPFDSYRPGQRSLAVTVFSAVRAAEKAFVQAPTGIGKTIATIFPAVKAVGEGYGSKIFFLTAKTVGRSVAENAFGHLRERGLRFKNITITSKEKICFSPGAACTPQECPYAKGYYDRLRAATADAFSADALDRATIEHYARLYSICPFEFSLDLSLWCDAVICDYNYVFDPRAYLRRYFDEEGMEYRENQYVLLIDEAHNLVDRSRDMFSAEVSRAAFSGLKRKLLSLRRKSGVLPARFRKLHEMLKDIDRLFKEYSLECAPQENLRSTEEIFTQKEQPENIIAPLRAFIGFAEKILVKQDDCSFRDELLERYFEAHAFLKINELYNDSYITFARKQDKDCTLTLYCLNPAPHLRDVLGKMRSTVYFSATLRPMDYFTDILGGDRETRSLVLPSPFPPRNLQVIVDDRIPTRYDKRAASYGDVAAAVAAMVNARVGNYLVFFPSYKYLREVRERLDGLLESAEVLCQSEGMADIDRKNFLDHFSTYGSRTLVGCAVMGGAFGEGIDLVGERLSGVAVVGVGLPQVCLERQLIRDHFQHAADTGFEYAFAYPGMNKVLQAVGRLIRTETDRGVALLIDERFAMPLYRNLLPQEWKPVRASGAQISVVCKRFWG